MKKRLFATFLSLCMVISLLPVTALAEEGGESGTTSTTSENTLQAKITAAQSTNTTITLDKDYTESITIGEKQTITLDLNGYKLVNSANAQDKNNKETKNHTITNKGTLTITDTSEAKTGTVDNVSHGKAALYNESTCTIEGGTLTRSAESTESTPKDGKGNSWYVIYNKQSATLEVKDATVTSQGNFSSLVDNNGTLTIEGGKFSNGMIVIKNEETGTLNISGGTFTASYYSEENNAVSALQNWGTATVSDGTFTSQGVAVYASEWDRDSSLTVTGGEFTGNTASLYVTSDNSDSTKYSGAV